MKTWLCYIRIINCGEVIKTYPAVAETEGQWTIQDKAHWEITEGIKAQKELGNKTACAQCYSIVEDKSD